MAGASLGWRVTLGDQQGGGQQHLGALSHPSLESGRAGLALKHRSTQVGSRSLSVKRVMGEGNERPQTIGDPGA